MFACLADMHYSPTSSVTKIRVAPVCDVCLRSVQGFLVNLYLVLILGALLLAPTLTYGNATGCPLYPPRLPPITNITTLQTLYVDDYGANGTDQTDDFTNIQNCINAAVASKQATEIRFTAAGIYILNPNGGGALSLNGATNIIFNGNDANILIENIQTSLLSVQNSDHVIVKGFTVDYNPLPFTQGTITAIKPSYVTVQLMPGFPSLNLPQFTNAPQNNLFFRDPNHPGRPKRNCNNSPSIQKWTDQGNNQFNVYIATDTQTASVGDGCIITVRGNGRPQVIVNSSTWVTVMNFTAYTTPAAFLNSLDSDYTGFINCQLRLAGNRWQTAIADDALAIRGEPGPWFENCYFEANGDDGVTFKGSGAQATSKTSPTVYTLTGYGGSGAIRLAKGDYLVAYSPTNGLPLAEANIVSVTGSNPYTVTLDQSLGVPAGITTNDAVWYDTNAMCNNFLIRNCTIKGSRRFGITISSVNGVVESNYIENCQSHAIVLSFVDLNNGFLAKNITLRNNVINDDYLQLTDLFPAAHSMVTSYIEMADRTQFAPWEAQENILIENNFFESAFSRNYLTLLCATNVTVCSNIFFTDDLITTNAVYAVEVRQSSQVDVTGNTIDDPRLNAGNAIKIWDSASQVSVQSNTVVSAVVTNLSPLVDTWINSSAPTTSYGSSTNLQVQNGTIQQMGLVKFPAGIGTNTIQWVKLKLAIYNPTQPWVNPQIYAAANGTWSGTVTWNTQPGIGSLLAWNTETFTFQDNIPYAATLPFDVTGFVQSQGTNVIPFYLWCSATNLAALAATENTIYNGPVLSVKLSSHLPPTFTGLQIFAGSPQLTGTGLPGRFYVLQGTTNLSTPVWTPLATNAVGVDGTYEFSGLPARDDDQHFYRTTEQLLPWYP